MLLNELFEFMPKSKHPASLGKSSGKYPFYTSSNTIDCYVDEPDYDGEYLIIGDGGAANCKYVNGKFSVSDHNYVLKPREGTNTKIIHYFLSHNNCRILAAGFKGVGIKNISKTYIGNIAFSKNTHEIDNIILKKLDAIHNLINKEKQGVFLYDELIKSRFILQEEAA